jgi:hypothetical protein
MVVRRAVIVEVVESSRARVRSHEVKAASSTSRVALAQFLPLELPIRFHFRSTSLEGAPITPDEGDANVPFIARARLIQRAHASFRVRPIRARPPYPRITVTAPCDDVVARPSTRT